MDPEDLTVYTSPYPKIRLGKNFDGGYVIADIPDITYSCLISGGISDDISFEEDFIGRYQVECHAFDGTISSLPKESSVRFTNKNIGARNTETTANLHDLIDNNDSIFVKMDIEGYEYSWLNSLSSEQMDKFSQITIEFHKPFNHDIFKKFSNHVLIHLHGNNCCGLRMFKGVQIPVVFECTYIHKKYVTELIKNIEPIPSALDMRNLVRRPELLLNFPPFVSKPSPIVKPQTRKHIGVINGRWVIRNPFISKS